MDFSKFRGSGDLSDITVTIENHDHKLHKFPFYARSDYFCELARSKPEREAEHVRVELDNFPGGNETFEQVADFCYNMPLEINKTNVVPLRCAAEYLKMFGPGNLTEKTDKFLASTVASAKMVKSASVVVSLLSQCNVVGDVAHSAGVVDLLVDALVDCWRKTLTPTHRATNGQTPGMTTVTSAFTRVSGPHRPVDKLDDVTLNALTSLRANWVADILTKAAASGVSCESVGGLAVTYISSALDIKHTTPDAACSAETPGEDASPEKGDDIAKLSSAEQQDGGQPLVSASVGAVDVGSVLDKIVLSLPEQAFSIPAVTMDWLTKVLRVATSHNCSCRGHLVRIAGEMLSHVGAEDLCVISPEVLHDIVADTSGQGEVKDKGQTGLHGERAVKLVDTYMGQMVAKGTLTSETFKLLTSATKNYPRPSHDPLFGVMLFVIKSEGDSLTPQAKSELTELVNLDLLTETSLQRALEDGVVPVDQVASSSLRLCSRLRSELASVKYIAEMQEVDIQKYQTGAKVKGSASPPVISDGRHAHPYSERARVINSAYTDSLAPEVAEDRPQLDHDASHHDDVMSPDPQPYSQHSATDPLRAAQGVLNAARYKLALPMYTSYRRHSPPTYSTPRRAELDLTYEEELDNYKFDRTFRSLDPRVRHQRLGGHAGHRTYFPYNHTHRF